MKPEVFLVRRTAHDDATGTLPEVFLPPLEVSQIEGSLTVVPMGGWSSSKNGSLVVAVFGRVSKEGKRLRRLTGLVVLLALVAAGCGGGDGDGGDLGEDVFGGVGESSGDVDSDDQGSSGVGTLENPTPEATSPLPADSIRIGDTAWERKIPTDGQCFVHEDDGTTPDSGNLWGSVNNDPEVEVRVKHNEDGSQSAQVDSNLIGWISGQMNGTELTVNLDFETSSISGEGLFYNTHADEWAYGSFAFTCLEGE